MDNRLVITMSGVVVLAIYAMFESSAIMGVSAIAAGIVVYLFRNARLRDRLIGITAAAIGGALAAEIVHTFYYHTNVAEPVADSGDLFLSAIQLGLINAAVIAILVVLAEFLWKSSRQKSE